MKDLAAIFIALFTLASCALTQLGSWWLARQIGAREAEYSVRIERSVPISASDGTKLPTDVCRPAAHFAANTAIDNLSCRKTAAVGTI
jgi:hypothetical protein